ncbi:Ser/Thr protein kinase RdoA (MazF antagonist) [Paenibacillus castaneae]|uniref:phosphotransferase enzyme family protein n=1 Tax=Paenibacillus castaneae TaxID=474957 RepID=UPI001FD0C1A5|nr:phosphotransferase [Paenibacillus castaneae]NIK77720.1 Ser/Thr protein kinase RdoA (MazF antagonist) [Paenibacillus castaneae]
MGDFVIDSDENIRKTIMQSKDAALRALQNFDLDWEHIRFNQLSDTCTFIIQTNKDGSFLLRIHSENHHEEINSELVWLDALNEKINVILPKGVLDRNGSRTVTVDQENGLRVYASLMRWVEGVHESGGYSEDQIYKEGVLLAKLHQASQSFEIPSNFTRPVWGEQSFKQAMERLTQHYDKFLTDAQFSLYQSAAERILSRITKLRKDGESYGLIHGDLHQGNIVFYNGEPRPIDFGRCGFGYFLYDIAHTILGLYPTQRELVVKGYRSIRGLGDDWLLDLESFTVMVMIENYCHHAPDPRETEGLKEEQPYAQAIIKNYLSGAPFLFNKLEI